jgi:hypothetical protein
MIPAPAAAAGSTRSAAAGDGAWKNSRWHDQAGDEIEPNTKEVGMEKEQNVQAQIQDQLKGIVPTAMEVITNPKEFFSRMPKTGGFVPPLVFMVALGLVSGLITAVLSLMGLGLAGAAMSGLAAIILIPIVVAIFGFVGAAILFVIWKIMGSQETFETAYRGMAYTAAIMPITTVLNYVPYIGSIIGLVWMTYLLVVISTEVHAIRQKTALIGFGAICAVFALLSISAETAGRRMAKEMEAWSQQHEQSMRGLEQLQEMSPEEAGKAMGEFFKGMQESMENKQE